jgi:5-methylcytosine-specific restriction endonuclease McrA
LDYLGYRFTPLHFFLLYRVFFEKNKERELKDVILKRDGFQCVDCGVTEKLQIHRTVKQKSWDTLTEWVTLCEECHIKQHGSGQFY